MTWWQALVLGLVQGLGEFLPISSSGHLVLFQNIFGMDGEVLLLDSLLHVATLAAVCIVLWPEIRMILRHPFRRLTWLLVVATIPAVIAALGLGDVIEQAFGGEWLGWGFLVTAGLMCLVGQLPLLERLRGRLKRPALRYTVIPACALLLSFGLCLLVRPEVEVTFGSIWLGALIMAALVCAVTLIPLPAIGRRRGKMEAEDISFGQALIMGLCQAVAIAPGISRSGSTLGGGLLSGVQRESATRFAFLMSIPAILGSLVFQAKDVLDMGFTAAMGGIGVVPLLLGMAAALVSGLFALKWMLKLVREGKLWTFGIYVAALAVLVLLDQSWWHLVF
jgi:undecaprenyl-diphosphatase